MKDGIIKGNGASRYLKTIASGLSQYPTYEDFMQALVEGTFPVDLFGRNPGGWTQEGTLLNKASLLTDETAAKYGFGAEATPNDLWSMLPNFGLIPVGSVFWLAREAIPSGYLKCDGAEISRTAYKRLFDAIGTAFGAGNGSTTFALPDLRAAFVRGAGSQNGYSATFAKKQEATHIGNGYSGGNYGQYGPYCSYADKTGKYCGASLSGLSGYTSWYVRPYNIALTPVIKY